MRQWFSFKLPLLRADIASSSSTVIIHEFVSPGGLAVLPEYQRAGLEGLHGSSCTF